MSLLSTILGSVTASTIRRFNSHCFTLSVSTLLVIQDVSGLERELDSSKTRQGIWEFENSAVWGIWESRSSGI